MDPASSPETSYSTRPTSVPENVRVTLSGFGPDFDSETIGSQLRELIASMGTLFDLSTLDGVTVAIDYDQALRDLDRGYATQYVLTPTSEHGVGVAMTPSVLRDGQLKSHLVANASVLLGAFTRGEGELAMHLLAHECAHVEVTAEFDRAFPNVLLQTRHATTRANIRWQIIMSCWDEYAACKRSARYGRNPAPEYTQTFLGCLRQAQGLANEAIIRYRTDGDVNRVLMEVTSQYAALLKFAAYLQGNLAGIGQSWRQTPELEQELAGHWFSPFFERLDVALAQLDSARGAWADQGGFEVIGDIAEELIASGGMHFRELADGRSYIEMPFTPETMPQ